MLVGTLDYVLMCALGIFVASRIARLTLDDHHLVLVPPAFAVFGGAYVHVHQLVIAAPAIFCILAYRERGFALKLVLALSLLGIALSNVLELFYGGGLLRRGSPPIAPALVHRRPDALASTIDQGRRIAIPSTPRRFVRSG